MANKERIGGIMRIKCFAALFTILFLFESAVTAGVGKNDTKYVGGTISSIKEGTEGKSSTADEKAFVFEYKGGKLSIPYDQINDLEYGQKAGRRVGLALTISPWLLLSKKRKHFLTVGYKDENEKQQAGVFEIGKDAIRVTLASLEARTGKKVDYQDEEARKSGAGN
jgi:hypothetical protein